MKAGMSIGAAAGRSGCSVATIRYYEEIGLLAAPARTSAGRRVYGMPHIERLRLVRRLREVGLGLAAIRAFVAALGARDPSCIDLRDAARLHLETVRAKKAELEALERTLARVTEQCDRLCADGPDPRCSIAKDMAVA